MCLHFWSLNRRKTTNICCTNFIVIYLVSDGRFFDLTNVKKAKDITVHVNLGVLEFDAEIVTWLLPLCK